MKIDKRVIDRLLLLNDEQLWQIIKATASKSGIEKARDLEKPKDMSKIRDALKNFDEKDIDKVTRLLKGGQNNG